MVTTMPAIPYSTKIHNSYTKTYLCTISYQSLFTTMPSIPYIGPSKQYHTICGMIYVELCTTSSPGHHHHLTKLALCLTSYDAASPAQRSVSKSTLCRPVVRYHLFVILHRLSNSFCDNGNKRFFEVDLPIDVLSPACDQKRAAKLEYCPRFIFTLSSLNP